VSSEGAREGSLLASCARATRGRGLPSLGLLARLGVPVGGRVRRLRAIEDQSAPIPEDTERAWREHLNDASRLPRSRDVLEHTHETLLL
jgi:hypothetical protein